MKKTILPLLMLVFLFGSIANAQTKGTNPPIYIAFHWHMHQPIYWPYESITQTESRGQYSFSVIGTHTDRTGPYTGWPKGAVDKGIAAGLGNFGAQVSFSGSLTENLNTLESAGRAFGGWKSSWNAIKTQKTSKGNPRIDMVAFGYHHPLMGLIDYQDIRKQIQAHKAIFAATFSGSYSKGIFPPENAFSERMIPALVDEGLQWAFVDNIHFERASINCPFSNGTGVVEPNKADVLNANPNDWKQLNGLWAPIAISMKWAHQPHYVQHVIPETGEIKKMIAVPTSRYIGNEDARGGFGALQYEAVLSQMESYNTDPNHPMLIVLHHDGDNYGGGTDSYYGSNFQAFVDWLKANPTRFVCTTVQDYLDMFPPDPTDLIHVQPGSWSGADNGDPEFKKWNGDPGTYAGSSGSYSPDRNSWGIITAAKNIVLTAEQINASSQATKNAWNYFMNSETSCYWYWDGTEMWDSHPARACNQAVTAALPVIQGGSDKTGPTIYNPQREPYNPGETEWGKVMSSDFTVWSYVYDYGGLTSVTLKYRLDKDGTNSMSTTDNETYNGGTDVEAWQSVTMTSKTITSITNPVPQFKADEYSGEIKGLKKVLIDYYIESVDKNGNVSKSDIQHVWIGDGAGSNPGGKITIVPANPTKNDIITITVTDANASTYLHWGIANTGSAWTFPIDAYRPAGTIVATGGAIQTPFTDPDGDGKFSVVIGPFNNAAQAVTKIAFVLKYASTWDNNDGSNYFITVSDVANNNPTSANTTVTTSQDVNYTMKNGDIVFVGMLGATYSGIKIVTLPTVGTLEYNGNPVIAGNDYADVTKFVFKPLAGATGSPYSTFTFKVKDNVGAYSDLAYTFTINVVKVNPTSANATVSTLQNTNYTFKASDIAFTGINGATFSALKLATLPAVGTLTYDGTPVAMGIDYGDVTKFAFAPVANALGSPYTTFTFYVKDSKGVYSEATYTMTINVAKANPTSANASISTNQSVPYTFKTSDFSFSSVNGATFAGIKIGNIQSLGTLKYNGVAVTAGMDCSDVTKLVYQSALGGSGTPYTTFTFSVKDNSGVYSETTYTMTINVNKVKISIIPANPTQNDVITIIVTDASSATKLHWGVNDVGPAWTIPNNVYWSNITVGVSSTAVQTSFSDPDLDGVFSVNIGPFNNAAQVVDKVAFVLFYGGSNWDNNNNSDYHITITKVYNPTSANTTVTTNKDVTYTFKTSDIAFTGQNGTVFTAFKLLSLPAAGTLQYGGANATINTDYVDVTQLTFKPATGASGSPYTTFTFAVKDNNGTYSQSYTVTVNVVTNPISANATVTTNQSVNYAFKANDIPFTGYNGATFTGIKLVSLPTSGTLEYNNITANTTTDYADLTKLVFKPVAGASGSPYTTFTFKVKDSNGLYSDTYTVTVNVLNTNPTSANVIVTTSLNVNYTFKTADFAFNGVNGATLAGFSLTSLPALGTLLYNNVPAVINTDYADIMLLTFNPAAAGFGSPYTSFTFKVKDNNGNYSSGNTCSINVLKTSPTSSNSIVTTTYNVSYTFQPSDFPFNGKNGATFTAIKLASLPIGGTLKYNGNATTTATDYTDVTKLVFKPSGSGSPYTTFTFYVKDNNEIYSESAYTMTINVLKANPVITWANPADIAFGTLLSGTQLNATADVAGSFVYTPANGAKLNVGTSQNLKADFTPTDVTNYNTVSKTVQINVYNNAKINPVITWSNPADIPYGTALSATQLNATANVAGTYVYVPDFGTKMNAGGNQSLRVDFIPTDANAYNSVSKYVQINVSKLNPVITWANPADIYYGTLISGSQLNATADISGTFTYAPINGTKLNVGQNQNLQATFTPTDIVNYNVITKTVQINVLKATPVITWANPADIIFGMDLNVNQLNASCDVIGTFVYTPTWGTKLDLGANLDLKVDFTPIDAANYTTATKTVKINVNSIAPTAQAEITSFEKVFGNTFTVNWTRGTGDYCAVFVSQNTSGAASPENGKVYDANATFGTGIQISSSGWFCVYSGTGTSVKVNGLKTSTDYRVMVVEFTNKYNYKNYLTTTNSNNPLNVRTFVPIEENIRATNFVTPNEDGKNDKWIVERTEELQNFDLYIFNNLGEILYQSKGYDNSWDATYKGKELPSGTYYYLFKSGDTYVRGFITVVR